MSDHYNLLGVPPGASDEEIRKAFRREAKRWHPDLHASKPAAEREALHLRFIQVAQAYQVLGDPEQRRAYDRRRAGDARVPNEAPRPSASRGSASQRPPPRPTPRPAAPRTAPRPAARPAAPPQPDLADVREILREAEGSLAKFGLDLRQPTEVVLEELLDWARGLYRDLAGAVRGKTASPSGPTHEAKPQANAPRSSPKPKPAASPKPPPPKPPFRTPESDAASLNELSVERELEQLKRGQGTGASRRTSTVDDELAELKRKHGK